MRPPCRRLSGASNLSAYRNDEQVLHDVGLVIQAGQTAALVGPTGAGKTSIANLVTRLYDVTAGAVCIDGIDVRGVAQRSLRRQTGLVPQEPLLFSSTLADNIRFGTRTRRMMPSNKRRVWRTRMSLSWRCPMVIGRRFKKSA